MIIGPKSSNHAGQDGWLQTPSLTLFVTRQRQLLVYANGTVSNGNVMTGRGDRAGEPVRDDLDRDARIARKRRPGALTLPVDHRRSPAGRPRLRTAAEPAGIRSEPMDRSHPSNAPITVRAKCGPTDPSCRLCGQAMQGILGPDDDLKTNYESTY